MITSFHILNDVGSAHALHGMQIFNWHGDRMQQV